MMEQQQFIYLPQCSHRTRCASTQNAECVFLLGASIMVRPPATPGMRMHSEVPVLGLVERHKKLSLF